MDRVEYDCEVALRFLPWLVGVWVRPILENSTACTCQMPNYPRPTFFGWLRIPLDQSPTLWGWHWMKSVDFVSLVMIELVTCRRFPGGLWLSFFTESLILAQDERWRRA